jgi:hypothetical protein
MLQPCSRGRIVSSRYLRFRVITPAFVMVHIQFYITVHITVFSTVLAPTVHDTALEKCRKGLVRTASFEVRPLLVELWEAGRCDR